VLSGAALTEAFTGYRLVHGNHSDVAIAPQANEL
jgi:hypothetical protein